LSTVDRMLVVYIHYTDIYKYLALKHLFILELPVPGSGHAL